MNFLWYYPRQPSYSVCYDNVNPTQWGEFLGSLDAQGLINWKYNSSRDEFFYQDGFLAIQQSQLINQPAKLEALIQDFYKYTPRMQLTVSNLINFINSFLILTFSSC